MDTSLPTHRPNFLILDEPTNHLDVETVDALAKALTKFKVRACVCCRGRICLIWGCVIYNIVVSPLLYITIY